MTTEKQQNFITRSASVGAVFDLPSISWSRDSNRDELNHLHRQAFRKGARPGDVQKLRAMRALVAGEFASEHGLTVSRAPFSVDNLAAGTMVGRSAWTSGYPCVDHPDYFKKGRMPAALVSHHYCPVGRCQDFAEAHGLMFIELPWSWYAPDLAKAGVFDSRLRR